VEARRASAAVARAQEDQAVARLWPKLSLSARYTRLSDIELGQFGGGGSFVVTDQTTPGPLQPGAGLNAAPPFSFPQVLNQYELRATLNVPVSDYVYRTGTAIDAAQLTAAAARHQEQAAKLQAAADARLAYYDWVRAIGQTVVAEQSLEHARAQLRDATALTAAGLMARADLLRAQAHAKNVEVLLVRARSFRAIADDRLRTLMHDRSTREYRVGEDLMSSPAPVRTLDTDAMIREAERNRAELRALRDSEASLRKLASLSRSQGHPRLDVTGNAIYANPNPRVFPQAEQWDGSWDASVVLSWSPTDIAGTSATAREQEARALELRAQRRQLLEGVRMEAVQAQQLVMEADASLASGREALVAAEESYRARQELLRSGKGTLIELNDAEVELTRARLSVINAQVDARAARVRLEHALGRDRAP
jgi:outer membrane protein TolC